MEHFGFIHNKLDLKILILYILRRLPAAIGREWLSELVLQDEGVSYFDFTECLAELQETDHAELTKDGYRITDKGIKNCDAVESSLPYTVRARVDSALAPVVRSMNRNSMIRTSHRLSPEGGCQVELSMEDGVSEVVSVRILAADEEQAEIMERKFRSDAEHFYQHIVEILSE